VGRLRSVFAYEGVACHEADLGSTGLAGAAFGTFDGRGELPCRGGGKS
jgi:hypothetical protein